MNPLHRNDALGTYPKSWYAETSEIGSERARLDGDRTCDVAIIGAGYTGLSTALHAAEKGLSVIVLEAHRVGFGASGRNGGQIGTGWNRDQQWLEKRVGRADARRLWDLTVEAKTLTRDLVARFAPESDFKPGVAHAEWTDKGASAAQAYVDWMGTNYDARLEYFGAGAFQSICKSNVYRGGTIDWEAGHIHPLRYVLGLARGAEQAGAQIFECSEVTGFSSDTVTTEFGKVRAQHVVVAGNGYLPDLDKTISSHVMPINSFIAATEPLGDLADEILSRDIAVADDRFVVNYFRLSEDRRLLFGGREAYTLGFPSNIQDALRRRMLRIFPQLTSIEIDYQWGGTLGITMTRLPFVRRIGRNTIAAGGFSGHGVAITGLVGKIIAEAIAGDAGKFELMGLLPTGKFPGGRHARQPLLTLGMTWFALRDRLGI